MLKFLRKIFKRKFKSYLLNDNYKVIEAFDFEGVKYFCFDDAFKTPTGRAMSALAIYEELQMKCNKAYLEKHCKAIDILLSDPKKINIGAIALIHNNLKERIQLAAIPDYIYKMASVMYFDATESPYVYDWQYNQKKIALFKKSPDALLFFLKGPLNGLMPSLNLSNDNALTYFNVVEQVDQMHQNSLLEVLSKNQ